MPSTLASNDFPIFTAEQKTAVSAQKKQFVQDTSLRPKIISQKIKTMRRNSDKHTLLYRDVRKGFAMFQNRGLDCAL